MSDRDILLLSAGTLFVLMVIPVSRRVRTTLLLLVIGFAAYWELTSGLLATSSLLG